SVVVDAVDGREDCAGRIVDDETVVAGAGIEVEGVYCTELDDRRVVELHAAGVGIGGVNGQEVIPGQCGTAVGDRVLRAGAVVRCGVEDQVANIGSQQRFKADSITGAGDLYFSGGGLIDRKRVAAAGRDKGKG